MDSAFDDFWENHWVKTIGSFFRFSQFYFLFKGTNFFIIYYIFICIYIIIFIILFLYIIIKSISGISANIIKFLALMFQLISLLNIPILKTLFSITLCKNDFLEVSNEIKCKSGIHIFLIVFSVILITIYKSILIIFHYTLYEFGVEPNKLKSGYLLSKPFIKNYKTFFLNNCRK